MASKGRDAVRAARHIQPDAIVDITPVQVSTPGFRTSSPPRLFERLVHMLVIVRDRLTAGIALAGELAYFVAGIEDELLGLIRGAARSGAWK